CCRRRRGIVAAAGNLMQMLRIILLIGMLVTAGCDNQPAQQPENPPAPPAEAAGPAQPTRSVRIVFLADRFTSGLGLADEQAFPALVGETLEREGTAVTVVNAGVSGDTTAGGLRRVDWLLKQKPDILVVGLGANDGLRAIDVKSSEQ